MKKVHVNGVELHYVEKGQGDGVVLVHGAVEDRRAWEPHANVFGEHYRAVAYSRRHSYPNVPLPPPPDHSAVAEAEDLARLIESLNLAPAHVIGSSYGAYTALFVAIHRPELIRSLILSEPPIIEWLPDLPGGQAVHDDFMANWWRPAAAAFRAGDDNLAFRITLKWWGLSWEDLPGEFQEMMLQNKRDLRAMVTSSNAFPGPSPDDVRRIRVRVLMLSGDRTMAHHRLIDAQIERTLPKCQRVIIDDASHEMWAEQPDRCRALAMDFLERSHGAIIARAT
jgi:pimeloyl-ACP methyl ester carboxylesterase